MDKSEELITANLVLPLVKDLVLPKIQSIIKKFSINNLDEIATKDNFEEYLTQRYEKFLIIDTLVFPNKQTLFKLLYEPLTVTTNIKPNSTIEIKINDFSDDFLPTHMRVIIEDTAGMGKSTITKKLFLSAIEKKAGIPILIELRQINKNNSFLNEIQNQLSPIGKPISLDVILKLILEGEFIFLFDGFDEISKADKEFVIKDLHKFIEKANDNYFLITSRQEDSLVSFGDFQKFNVKPLNHEEAFGLINRYDTYSFKPIANEIIFQLKEKKDKSLNEFLSNPFLVSLLYKSFEYKKDIPIKKTQFYRQVYDALFESHDLSKEGYLKRDKHSNLHLDDFERVLRYIGYFTSIENKVEYDKDYIINIIEKAKKYTSDLDFKSSDYLRDLLETVPLFKKDGNFIKWGHKSLQDYFAAKFIWIDSKQNQLPILKKIYNDKQNQRFYNVLDLFYELDPNLFECTILYWILEDFEKYINKSYINLKEIKNTLIKQRISYTFHTDNVIVVTKKEHYKAIRTGVDDEEIFGIYSSMVKESYLYSSVRFNYFKNPKIVVFTFIKRKSNIDTLLRLISNRIPDLINFGNHILELNSLPFLKEGNVYYIDDKIENIVNNKIIFDIVNELLNNDYSINYDNGLKKLAELKSLQKQDKNNDFTEW